MAKYTRAAFIVLVLMLFLNIFFMVVVLGVSQISGFSVFSSNERYSPSDFIARDEIGYGNGTILIEADNVVFSHYTNSESMSPLISETATGIGMRVDTPGDIQIGDVISFYRDEQVIVHRVVEKGEDKSGVYFITRGDNANSDDGKVYFTDVVSVLIGVVY